MRKREREITTRLARWKSLCGSVPTAVQVPSDYGHEHGKEKEEREDARPDSWTGRTKCI